MRVARQLQQNFEMENEPNRQERCCAKMLCQNLTPFLSIRLKAGYIGWYITGFLRRLFLYPFLDSYCKQFLS